MKVATIIGTTDMLGDSYVKLYYGEMTNIPYNGCRDFKCRDLVFAGSIGVKSISTKVDNLLLLNSVRLYPNPANANEIITLSLPKKTNIQITIVDITGKVVLKSSFSEKDAYQFSVSTFKSGIYNIIIKAGNESYQSKLIVK